MKKIHFLNPFLASLAFSFFFITGNVSAQCRLLNENFNTAPVLAPGNSDGAWYPDRYRPAGFTTAVLSGSNVLKISIDGINDRAANRPSGLGGSFYNTQGRKFNQCGGCVTVMKGDLWIPADWKTKHRRSDMWASAYDNSNAVSAYPIIGFRNPDGNSPGIYYWDDNVGWIASGVKITYNKWYKLEFRLAGSNIEYLVNSVLVGTVPSAGSAYFGDIIMQAYNFNDPALPLVNQSPDSYDAYWDNLQTTGKGGNVVTNLTTGQTFCSIQNAIDAPLTVAGNTISVGPGIYAENVIVNKSVSLLGPNSAINPCSGGRVAEAIVVPASAGISFGEIFHVAASNVTIKGFTIDGDNTSITSGFTSTNGADIDAAEGITVYETGINNLTASNNIIRNLSYFGITLYGKDPAVACSGHVISNNKIRDIGTYDGGSGIDYWGGAVLLYNNHYAAVTNNCIDNVRIGIQTGNFYAANPGSASCQVISGNSMTNVRRRGIFHNLFYGTASGYTVSNNSVTGVMNANELYWNGILVSSQDGVASVLSGNTVNGSAVSNPSSGIEVWNVKSSSPAAISGGSITGVNNGVFINNYDGYPSTGSDASFGGHATITAVTISPKASGTGVYVKDNILNTSGSAVSVVANNNFITGGTSGFKFEGFDVSGSVHNNSITGQSGQAINASAYTAATPVDATCNWYGTVTAASVAAEISGTVTYVPYLVSGTDNSAAAGFQPVPNSCGGQPSIMCGKKLDKITICHNGHEICVDENAVPEHLAHGDNLGPCAYPPCEGNINFSNAVILSPTQAPNQWYTDRYAPAGFTSPVNFNGNSRLKQSIAVIDGANTRPPAFSAPFYNTQGRKYDVTVGTRYMEIELYIPSAWQTTGRRMAGFWGTAFDNANNVSAFPIIEFTSDGGVPRFRGWESGGLGSWVDMGLPSGFSYNKWYKLSIELLSSGEFRYQVNNLQMTTTTSAPDASTRIGNVILQGHNTTTGVGYDIYWDDFEFRCYKESGDDNNFITGSANKENITAVTDNAKEFKLANAPNPLNTSTTIRYELPVDSRVNITLYDPMGKVVAVLVDASRNAGVYNYVLDASRLASGLYYYKMTAVSGDQKFVQDQKLLIIK